MATTTTNFGWDIPQSTDLVKDGATAIAALGQDIDTAMVDLKGGTTGQVLAKASGTDLDFSWVAQDDSNAIQNAIVDAKGDLIGATAADTPARLAVGTNGQVLTADSAESTGLKWATPSGSAGPTFSAYANSNFSMSAATFTKVQIDTELWDSDSCYDTTNYRFTPNKAGYYQINVNANANAAPTRILTEVYKNGSSHLRVNDVITGNDGAGEGSVLVSMNGTTDYLEFYLFTVSACIRTSGAALSRFSAIWLRSL
jgi:hypothetical protein